MKPQGFWPTVGNYARKVLLIELGLLAAVGLICKLMGWHTVSEYGLGLILAGVAIGVFGMVSLFGGVGINADTRYRYSQSVMSTSLHDRTRRVMLDLNESWAFAVVAALLGLITGGIGVLILLSL